MRLQSLLALTLVTLVACSAQTDSDEDDGGSEILEEVGTTSEEEGALTGVRSPVPGRAVSYPFGVRNSRYAAGYHTGDDYAAPTGTKVVAVRAGTIRWSNGDGGAYGSWIGLDADNGRTYVYCHLSARAVRTGERVAAGETLGRVGTTGMVTGPHLHFEDHPRGPFVYGKGREPRW
jgi:murein DD-endopeptidase MepM/ murein hydrolase activator NlpD